jgi:hypothetical protein
VCFTSLSKVNMDNNAQSTKLHDEKNANPGFFNHFAPFELQSRTNKTKIFVVTNCQLLPRSQTSTVLLTMLSSVLSRQLRASSNRIMNRRYAGACSRFAETISSSQSLSSSTTTCHRSFSQLPPDDPQARFKPSPPSSLNLEMAEGIQQANQLILKHGVGKQRLELLAQDKSMPLVVKWQRMMEIYLGAQLHVVAALGYETNEQGIMMYTQQLAQFVGAECSPEQQDTFRQVGRDTWRNMLVKAFDLDTDMIEEKYGNELSIVDARNIVHKVASKLIEPSILEEVAKRVGELPIQSSSIDPQQEMGMKHGIIQDVVVNQAYLGDDPSLVEELGFGSGPGMLFYFSSCRVLSVRPGLFITFSSLLEDCEQASVTHTHKNLSLRYHFQ